MQGDWEFLCDAMEHDNIFCRFDGKFFKLANSFTVSQTVGSDAHPFCGNIDGNSKTLTFNCTASGDYCAPFACTSNTTSFRNLTVNGTINTSYGNSAGLIGHLGGNVTIEKCSSNIRINSSTNNAGGFVGLCEDDVSFKDCVSNAVIKSSGGNNSGFVGWSRSSAHTISFEGCVFSGKLLKKDGSGGSNGCFVGWKGDAKTVNINRCLCVPAALSSGEANASDNSVSFSRQHSNYAAAITNCYYIGESFGDAQGASHIYCAEVGDNTITVTPSGELFANYTNAQLNIYRNTIVYKNKYYGANQDILILNAPDAPEGYVTVFLATSGVVNGTMFQFSNSDTVITKIYGPETCNVNWYDYNGTLLATSSYSNGSVPTYPNSSNPARASDKVYYYTFSGWNPQMVGRIYDHTDYVAQYTAEPIIYTVIWQDYQGNSLESYTSTYSSTYTYHGSTPTKPADDEFTYTSADGSVLRESRVRQLPILQSFLKPQTVIL